MNKSAKAFYTSGREEMAKVRAEASKAVQQAADEGVKAVQAAAESAGAVVAARADEASDRAEKLTAATNKIEARQLWSAAAAFALALMPAAILVLGWTLGIVGLIWTWQLVAAADLGLVQRIVRGALAVLGLTGALWVSFLGLRWTTQLVGFWKVKGAPLWPGRSR